MGAPGLQLQLHQGAGAADAQHPVMGAGGLAAGVHRPPVRGALCQADGGVYNAGGGGGRTVADGQVHPAEAPGVELELQPFLGVGVLGRHQQARGALVQPVDRVEIGLLPSGFVMIHQKITQSIVKMAVSGVDQHPGGLVEDDQIPVLVQDVQRALRRDHAGGGGRGRQARRQRLPLPHPDADVHPRPVQGDAVLQPLDPPQHRAGQAQAAAQEGIHLQPRQPGGDV